MDIENRTGDEVALPPGETAKTSGWTIDKGDHGAWECICKAHDATTMKSTKRMAVPGGWLYQVTTEIRAGGHVAVAEALEFVPHLIWGEVIENNTRETTTTTTVVTEEEGR